MKSSSEGSSEFNYDRTHFEEDVHPTGWRWSVPRFLGFATFLILALFWIWVFANRGSIAHPDEFADPVFSEAAETICAATLANIAEFPIATAAEGPVERSELVALGTAEIKLMVAQLAALTPPTDPQGASGVLQWLEDYDLYISDREVWTAQLAEGRDEAFLLSANAQGGRVTDLLGTFSEVNNMASCSPSGDA